MFDKILVPVDGSDASERAAHIAADLASRCGAEVIVMHVLEGESLYCDGSSWRVSEEPPISSIVMYGA